MNIRRFVSLVTIGFALLGARPIVSSAAKSSTACLDSSSPSFAVDSKVIASLGRYGDPLTPFVFNGEEGVSETFFRFLSRTKCGIIMGFPVDIANPDPPDGLALTNPYLHTAYVLASPRKLTQAELRPGMTIAVGMATTPHFYLAGAFGSVPNYTANTFQTQEQVLDAVTAKQADAAMVWEPSVVRYENTHPNAIRLKLSPLTIPHSTWNLAALYSEHDAGNAARFNEALSKFAASGELAHLTKPYVLETLSK